MLDITAVAGHLAWLAVLFYVDMRPKASDRMANSADPDQTALERSDRGLHCLSLGVV